MDGLGLQRELGLHWLSPSAPATWSSARWVGAARPGLSLPSTGEVTLPLKARRCVPYPSCAESSACSPSRTPSRIGWASTSRMLRQMSDRGPDSAGVAVYRDPVAHGHSKLRCSAADRRDDWTALVAEPRPTRRRRAGQRAVRHNHALADADRRAADAQARARAAPRPARDERRRGRSRSTRRRACRALRRAVRARRHPRHARDRPHAHGDRERGHDRAARTRSRPARTSASCTTARSRTTTALRRELRREGIEFQTENDTEVAAGYLAWRLREGDALQRGARGLPRRPRRLLHLRGRHARRLRRAARPDRLQAGRHGRDRRLGRDGLGVPRDRGAARRRRRPLWEPEPAHVYVWERERSDGRDRRRGRDVDLAADAAARAQPAPPRPRRRRPAAPLRVTNPSGAHASPAASTPRSRSTSRGTWATTAPA